MSTVKTGQLFEKSPIEERGRFVIRYAEDSMFVYPVSYIDLEDPDGIQFVSSIRDSLEGVTIYSTLYHLRESLVKSLEAGWYHDRSNWSFGHRFAVLNLDSGQLQTITYYFNLEELRRESEGPCLL